MRAAPEISFWKTVSTGKTFQWHRIGHKTCLLVWHIQPAQQTQSVPAGRMTTVFNSGQQIKWLHSKPNQNYRGNEWPQGFWHVSNLSRDFERDWARAYFLPADEWSPTTALKSLSTTSQPQKTPQLGRNGSSTHLWKSQVNWLCPC